MDLVSHTTYVVSVNFIHEWRDLQLKIDSERQIFLEKLFMAILFTLRVFARNLLRGKRRKKYVFIFRFIDAWSTHYLLDYGDFLEVCIGSLYSSQLSTFQAYCVYFNRIRSKNWLRLPVILM